MPHHTTATAAVTYKACEVEFHVKLYLSNHNPAKYDNQNTNTPEQGQSHRLERRVSRSTAPVNRLVTSCPGTQRILRPTKRCLFYIDTPPSPGAHMERFPEATAHAALHQSGRVSRLWFGQHRHRGASFCGVRARDHRRTDDWRGSHVHHWRIAHGCRCCRLAAWPVPGHRLLQCLEGKRAIGVRQSASNRRILVTTDSC